MPCEGTHLQYLGTATDLCRQRELRSMCQQLRTRRPGREHSGAARVPEGRPSYLSGDRSRRSTAGWQAGIHRAAPARFAQVISGRMVRAVDFHIARTHSYSRAGDVCCHCKSATGSEHDQLHACLQGTEERTSIWWQGGMTTTGPTSVANVAPTAPATSHQNCDDTESTVVSLMMPCAAMQDSQRQLQ